MFGKDGDDDEGYLTPGQALLLGFGGAALAEIGRRVGGWAISKFLGPEMGDGGGATIVFGGPEEEEEEEEPVPKKTAKKKAAPKKKASASKK